MLKKKFGIEITGQTLLNWFHHLCSENLIEPDKEFVRYVVSRAGEAPKEITKLEYNRAWTEFFNTKEETGEPKAAWNEMYAKHGGKVDKRLGFIEKALEQERMSELRRILEEMG